MALPVKREAEEAWGLRNLDEDKLNPLVEVTISGKGLRKRTLIATVDTGYNDHLCIPLDLSAQTAAHSSECR